MNQKPIVALQIQAVVEILNRVTSKKNPLTK